MKHICKIVLYLFSICILNAEPAFCTTMEDDVSIPTESPDFISASELLARTPDDTQCATTIFENALANTASQELENALEEDVQKWIYKTFQDKDVLQQVLACPEFENVADDETITFLPIKYTFPNGREIVINYETQPKILKQRILIGEKQQLPFSDPNPRVGAPEDENIWTNTDPAWYAIMVVESGTLDNFVGPGKNNTISLQYVEDNIDTLFPRNSKCTGKSALTNDNTIINQAMKETVNLEKDTNDYYVAGDVNLRWISYLEIGLDVALTVVTMGGGTVVLGATKAARASRALKNLSTSIKTLREVDSVRDYIRLGQKSAKAVEELKTITDAAKYAEKTKEIENITKAMRDIENADDSVRRYKQYTETFTSLNRYRNALRIWRPAQRGNIVARIWRAVRTANTGGKELRSAAKIAKSSTLSGRVRDWLFRSSLSNIGALAKLERKGGFLYGTLKFVGGFWDWTETSTGEFTSDIEFKPLTLLSADDLQGQENVVNHGMWLMWAGDAYSAADDDAAFLQAMDFSNKFHFNLEKVQQEQNTHACNVDIYVVRPIIRNPDSENPELYYLIMNDEPWTTSNNTDE